MANIKAVTFHTDFCQDGAIKYEAGKSYPKNADTDRCVALNFGTSVTLNESFVSPLPVSAEQAEAERIAAEQAEAERIAAEQAEAEAERIAAEQAAAEAERIAAEQAAAEAERIAAEQNK